MSWSVRSAWLEAPYRYTLVRAKERGLFDEPWRTVLFVMLNPSKADAHDDDPTIRRCVGFAEAWGFSRLIVGNLFAYVSTDPKGLRDLTAAQRIGPSNDRALATISSESELVVCAWGNLDREYRDRAKDVLAMLRRRTDRPIECLGTTKSGDPKHPVRLASLTERVAFA